MKLLTDSVQRSLLLRPTIALVVLTLSACAQVAPQRSFSTSDMLISPDEVPQEWRVVGESRAVKDHIAYSAVESSKVVFETADHLRGVASNYAYRYDSESEAKRVFKKWFAEPLIGETPSGWQYQSQAADDVALDCHDYGGREPLSCEWASRYEEHIVTFSLWLVPGRVSRADLERAIGIIDTRVTALLSAP